MARLLRIFEIYGIDLHQGKVALALLGAADLAFDGVAGPQGEFSDLAGADVDVIGSCEVVRVGRAQEAEAILQHFDHTFADDLDITGSQVLENAEEELLLAESAGVLHLQFLGNAHKFRRRLLLEVLKLDFFQFGNVQHMIRLFTISGGKHRAGRA